MNDKFIISEKDRNIFEFILDNIPDSITIVDANCRTVFFNKSCEKYYNVKREDIIGKDIREFFPNSLLPKVIVNHKSYDNIFNSPRENNYTVISAVPLYDDSNNLIGGLARDRDITELVKLSDTLHKTQASLINLENKYVLSDNKKSYFNNLIGISSKFIQAVNLCKNVSRTPMNILLRGESGTGKEVFAKAIHMESGRSGNFVAINCSAIPSELFESELFGYEKGAFTGAKRDGRIGKFEEADGGTIFLDEIGDMPINLQPKMLRVLEDGYITRIGGNNPKKIDVRIISATNKDIKNQIATEKFRRDLYYRLDAFQIDIPPLRERGDDIILLANNYLKQFCMEQGMNILEISKEVEKLFLKHYWEGNVRELKNVVQFSAVFAAQDNEKKIRIEHLPNGFNDNVDKKDDNHNEMSLSSAVEKLEIEMITKAMQYADNNIVKAAKILQIPRTTLYYKIEKYKLL